MVLSRLDPNITYKDTPIIDKEDIGYDATQFEIELFPNTAAVIALGNVKYTFSGQNVLYVPVYLIKDGEVQDQIGVYEFLVSEFTQILDEDNDIDIDKLSNPFPLYYDFFNEKFLRAKLGDELIHLSTGTPAPPTAAVDLGTEKKDSDEEFLDEEVEADEWTSPNSPTVLEDVLGSEEKTDISDSVKLMNQEMREREKYKPQTGDSWIKKFMRNGSYSLQDNEGGGDCLFAVIRDAFRGISREITVAQLREIVSKAADQTVFTNFKEHYDMYKGELSSLTAKQLEIRDKIQVLKVQFKTAENREDKVTIAAEAKELTISFNQMVREKRHARELVNEFKWMHGVTDLTKFKAKIKTCRFWAEGWAINILERALNIKLIILSSENYRLNDLDNVLQCGDMVDADIRKKGEFTPKHYIITSYRGDHYILIKYNDKRIFTFTTLPFTIKQIIINKCMEDGSDKGIYNLIPDFQILKKKLAAAPITDSGAEDIGLPSEEKSDEGYKSMKQVSFDPDTIFQFYSRSSGKPKPGKGSGEKINKDKILEYSELASIPDWRKVLSNFYITAKPFELDGKHWATVENFYHASKFKKANPEYYATFSVDSGSELSQSPEMAKGVGGKTGKYKGKQLRPKTIKIDPDFFTTNENERAMFRGQMAKYQSDNLAKKVLLATKDAKLQHFIRAAPPVVFYNTMKIREILNK